MIGDGLTANDLRVVDAVSWAEEQWDGYCPHGARDWIAIRRLEKLGKVKSTGSGECQTCPAPHDCQIFVLTDEENP
jgi:hypothetical protein